MSYIRDCDSSAFSPQCIRDHALEQLLKHFVCVDPLEHGGKGSAVVQCLKHIKGLGMPVRFCQDASDQSCRQQPGDSRTSVVPKKLGRVLGGYMPGACVVLVYMCGAWFACLVRDDNYASIIIFLATGTCLSQVEIRDTVMYAMTLWHDAVPGRNPRTSRSLLGPVVLGGPLAGVGQPGGHGVVRGTHAPLQVGQGSVRRGSFVWCNSCVVT